VLAKGFSSSGDEPRGEYIIVTAHVEPAAARSAQTDGPRGQGELRIFNLANAKARDAGQLMERMFGDKDVRIGVDEATNTVIVSGNTEQLRTIEALLQRLDESKK
jgi:type II secretory pathway component GspD/PulD (secretin)